MHIKGTLGQGEKQRAGLTMPFKALCDVTILVFIAMHILQCELLQKRSTKGAFLVGCGKRSNEGD